MPGAGGTEFPLCKTKKVLEIGSVTMGLYLTPQNGALKNDYGDTLHVMCILPQLKKAK